MNFFLRAASRKCRFLLLLFIFFLELLEILKELTKTFSCFFFWNLSSILFLLLKKSIKEGKIFNFFLRLWSFLSKINKFNFLLRLLRQGNIFRLILVHLKKIIKINCFLCFLLYLSFWTGWLNIKQTGSLDNTFSLFFWFIFQLL